jgi:hypothetical protein
MTHAPDDVDRADPSAPEWIALGAIPAPFADAVRAQLDAHGIDHVIEEAPANAPDAALGHVIVCVLQEDAEAARELIARRPEPDDAADDVETPAERDARLLEDWVCPRCHQQSLDLLPPSHRYRRLRRLFLGLVLVSFGVGYAVWGTDATFRYWLWAAAIALVTAWLLLQPDRAKRCKQCGWQSAA